MKFIYFYLFFIFTVTGYSTIITISNGMLVQSYNTFNNGFGLQAGDELIFTNIYVESLYHIGFDIDPNCSSNGLLVISGTNVVNGVAFFDTLISNSTLHFNVYHFGTDYNQSFPLTVKYIPINNPTNCAPNGFIPDKLYAYSSPLNQSGVMGVDVYTSGSPLPINLAKIDVKQINRKNYLTWQTASEVNNSHFEIEHSKDGINFKKIDIVKGGGNSTSILDYGYTHIDVEDGIHYYRLKQVDFDGTFDYSDVVTVNVNNSKYSNDLTIYPNPSNGIFNINSDKSQVIKIYDVLGNLKMTKNISEGKNLINTSEIGFNGLIHIKDEYGKVYRLVME
jgi:hypothetical protein